MSNESQLGSRKGVFPYALLVSTTLFLGGCAATQERSETAGEAVPVAGTAQKTGQPEIDPYEGFNRSMYGFNMKLDKYFLKPVADGYKTVTPKFVQTGVTNFFTNLKGINVALNDALQGKFEHSASDLGRFTTNSTIGLLGLFDVATELGIENNVEDFGQTLAVWGVDQGPYLVLPILGPTTVRDGSAVIVDKAANPGTYVPGTGIVEGINDRANAEGALNFIDEAALDPYVFTRESFLQYRKNLVNDGKSDANSYELDIDAEVDKAVADSAAKPAVADTGAKKSEKAGSSRIDNAKPKKDGSAKAVDKVSSAGDSTTQAFDSMSKSFDVAELEFEKASQKMDEISKKKKTTQKATLA